MTSDKIEKYRALELRRQGLVPGSPDDDAILDELDTVWFSMSNEEIAEIDKPGAPFRAALEKVNEQYGETFKKLAASDAMTEDRLKHIEASNEGTVFPDRVQRELCAEIRRLRASAQALAEAASGVLSPCDDSEKERGYCMGHGQCNRLPCEFAELRTALDAFRAGGTK